MDRLYEIITETAHLYRKGEAATVHEKNGIQIVDLYMMPHIDEASPELEIVDMWFVNVGVRKELAQQHRDELVLILQPWQADLEKGLSYIHIGGLLGSQDMALLLMAIGKVLGFWSIITPEFLASAVGVSQTELNELAGRGFIMCDGFRP